MKPTVLREIQELIGRTSVFVHVTHVNPDADGLGSALAMSRHLRRLGKDSRVLLTSPVPHRLDFLVQAGEVHVHDAARDTFADDAALLIYDVSTLDRLGSITLPARAWKGPRLVFDHHDGNVEFPAIQAVDRDAAATAQLVFEAFESWNVPIDLDLAAPLYVGLIADSGSFNYGKTTPRTHQIAARLLEAGVDPLAIHGQLEGSSPLAAVQVAGRVMAGLALDAHDRRIAHATLTHEQWLEAGADALDTVDLVNTTISLDGVHAGFLLIHVAPDTTRLSMRSKNRVDIVEVAKSFGGGGHTNAAGATLSGTPDAVRDEVLTRLRRHVATQLGPPPTR